jgi:tetratricopeptide (TPR) repeat protein
MPRRLKSGIAMKNYIALFFAIAAAACAGTKNASTPAGATDNANAPLRAEKIESTIAHSSENQTPANPPSNQTNASASHKRKWSQSGEPIDTAKFDGVIAEAEKTLKAKPNDEGAKKVLSEAYFDRGFALTEARQYAAALGDFRRALKYDPTNEEAKNWINQIIDIYNSMAIEYPKEGEEPPPLPFGKAAGKTDSKKP